MTKCRALLFLAVLAHSPAPFAAEPAVIEHPEAVVTRDEVAAEVSNWDLDKLRRLADAPQLPLFANDLILRSVLAGRARAEGLDQDPVVRLRIKAAQDKVLYDVFMERAEEAKISRKGAEGLARDEYRANPEKFTVPEQIRVRHILIRPTETRSADEAKKLADELLARLKAGEDFEALAAQYSEDPSNAKKGGDLGFFGRGQMVGPFDRAAFTLTEPGQLSEVVGTQFGYHIIRFEERKAPALKSYEEVKDSLTESIYRRMRSPVRSEIALPIVDHAVMKVDLDRLANILREEADKR